MPPVAARNNRLGYWEADISPQGGRAGERDKKKRMRLRIKCQWYPKFAGARSGRDPGAIRRERDGWPRAKEADELIGRAPRQRRSRPGILVSVIILVRNKLAGMGERGRKKGFDRVKAADYIR